MDPDRFRISTAGKAVLAPGGFWVFIPNPLPPDLAWSDGLVAQLALAERNLAALAEKGSGFISPQAMVQPFIRREAVLSSRIEGTRTTLDELYRYEARPPHRSRAESDAPEVKNYVHALQYGMDRLDTLPLSLRLIREIHAKLFDGLPVDHLTPGEFRRSQNWAGPAGSTLKNAPYVPPPVGAMHDGLDQLERYIYAPSTLPALIRIGLIHYQFEAIHPFLDGNGRIGRLIVSLLMHLWDLLPHPWINLSGYFEANRQAYYDSLLEVSERGEWIGWLTLFLEAVSNQAEEAAFRLTRLETLQRQYLQRLGAERKSSGLMRVLDFLFAQPMVTVRQVEREIEASDFKVAQRYILKLIELGILREITGGSRNRIYRADEIFEAIQGVSDL
ncbi:MAG: Fic family protein [Anaerolineae bacterium]|nr:MAG: Fic family protein [Anaerolineae bacterium]